NPIKIKITSSQIIYDLIISQWNSDIIEYQEEVKVIYLNKANIVLGIYDLSKGGISGSIVDIRVILGIALKCNSTSVILAHNHPSGNLKPSNADKIVTKNLKDACNLLDISLLDHLIVTKNNYFSFSDEGIL
ncbi:JAB domain-containing protein, partial [Flavobacterium sp.]|uniref:JAB domain-containing protein n=1 Tax=Flavobacterium sp. TaxID=239 RepID=UPI00342509C0